MPGAPDLFEGRNRIADLAAQQSNTVALLGKLAARTGDSESLAQTPERRQARLDALQTSASDAQRKLEAARHKVAELLTTLNLPPEISTVEPEKALDMADLKPYWPYFEAKRERETQQLIAERLRLRVIQEKVDLQARGEKTDHQ